MGLVEGCIRSSILAYIQAVEGSNDEKKELDIGFYSKDDKVPC